jgi:hypothetical protein
MNGTRSSQTRAIDLIPPRMTTAVRTVRTPPLSQGEMPNVSFARTAIEFAWTVFPMPNAATAVNAAKRTPSHFIFRPRSRTYIGPPDIVPSASFTRYFTERSASEYFVAIRRRP